MLKKILPFIIFILVCFTGYLSYNALTLESRQTNFEPVELIDIKESAIHHLSEAIKIKTVSTANRLDFDSAQFDQFGNFLSSTYPRVKKELTKRTVNQFSFLYKWQGENNELKPVILVAHLDVVPVPEAELNKWNALPFSGEIKEDTIWGRGALDDKVSIVGILEAVEYLLSKDYRPQRTIYLAFGHDEETGGLYGTRSIVNILKHEGVQPEFVLDEGSAITQGLVPGVLTDVALIGIAEKGFASLTLSIYLDGGHSSMPNSETAIEVITNAIALLKKNPFPPEITKPVQQFIDHVGPEMRFQEKLIFANSALFRSIIIKSYSQSGPGRAVVQTTAVPTVFNSGIKENVVPSRASVTVNFRILPGTSIAEVIERVKSIVKDERIEIKLLDFHSEPSKVSGTSTLGYSIIDQSIKEVFPHTITVPNLTIAATDGRYYKDICDNVYRFLPIQLNRDNINAIHGINENIAVGEFKDVIRFYIQLIKNCNSNQ